MFPIVLSILGWLYVYIYISYNILITLYNYIIVYSPSSEAVTIHETILR